jgi:hypothetical protein
MQTSDPLLSSSGRLLRALSQPRVSKFGHPLPASETVPPAAVTQRPQKFMRSGDPAPTMASPERAALLIVTTSANEPLNGWPQ